MAKESALARVPLGAKLGISALLLILMGAGYLVFFYNDLASKVSNERNQTSRLQQELASAKQAEFAYQKDLAELTDRQQRQRELNKVLPPDAQMPAFLDSVQNVANVSAVSLLEYSPEPQRAEKFYARVPMQVKLKGRFHQVAKFFYEMGQLDRVINMENIAMELAQSKTEEDVLVKVSALATAFRAKKKSEQGKKKGKRKRRRR